MASADGQTNQLLLRLAYRDLLRRGAPLPDLADAEFRCYSQNGEDGVLLYLFSVLGTTGRRVVEICAGEGTECNAANLIINHGWQGLLFDGDPDNVARGTTFFGTHPNTRISPPRFVHAWITAENVNSLVSQAGFAGPIDLLSMDVDGNDYWLLGALTCVQPSVVVVEFNAACGPHRAVAMGYSPGYRLDYAVTPYRCGASLGAFTKLARSRGYRLVGVQSNGFNAFFVRNGLGDQLLPERSPEDCYRLNQRLAGWHPTQLDQILAGPEPWEDV